MDSWTRERGRVSGTRAGGSPSAPDSLKRLLLFLSSLFFFFYERRLLFVSSHPIGPLKHNAACDWLSASCRPKVDSGEAVKKKNQPRNCTMRLPAVGLE